MMAMLYYGMATKTESLTKSKWKIRSMESFGTQKTNNWLQPIQKWVLLGTTVHQGPALCGNWIMDTHFLRNLCSKVTLVEYWVWQRILETIDSYVQLGVMRLWGFGILLKKIREMYMRKMKNNMIMKLWCQLQLQLWIRQAYQY